LAGLLQHVEVIVIVGTDAWSTGVIAVDGPAASGKSTLARRVAEELGISYLDTGAFYRAAALAVLRAGADFEDESVAVETVRRAVITQDEGRTWLDGEEVESQIRSRWVTEAASKVATLPGVRQLLVQLQRNWVEDRGGSAVVEGRDIGSVVFPDASLKVFLTADPRERTRRRLAEMTGSAEVEIGQSLARRDEKDTTRAASPLRRMPEAVEIDTTSLSPEAAALKVLKAFRARSVAG
jgi:cytidylate kinase